MTQNERLYSTIKELVVSSPYLTKNLPMSYLNQECAICGKVHDYRLVPMLTKEEWERLIDEPYRKEMVCDRCMEKANGGKFRVEQLLPCTKTINYLFCNSLVMNNTKEEYFALLQCMKCVIEIIQEHDA